jgi:thiosulfate reductase cytochrome b subunit
MTPQLTPRETFAKAMTRRAAHPLFLRCAHWAIAIATLGMIASGWRIYNASPLFGFVFPVEFSLGGWLAGALAWHFSLMWLLFAGLAAYFAYALASGRFLRALAPPGPLALWRDAVALAQGRLDHDSGDYNAFQRLAYLGALAALLLAIGSGFAIWKPVQLYEITQFFGGFEKARRVHFFAMAALCAFCGVHIYMALTHKAALRAMTTGAGAEAETTQ